MVIKNSKLRGVESFGMICASDEIGLGDLFPASREAEILDLSAFDVPAGTPLAQALDMDDVLLEIDNKSMTNRPDLWGHYGIAREIGALYDLPLTQIEPYAPDGQAEFKVEILDPDRCPRYIGVEMSGVEVKASPYRMRNRIWKAGMRPINALVDITNYAMLATGNPTHAFDADHITDHITVRPAAEGEVLALLNGKELKLCEDDLVIADAKEPVALAGVMGGSKDSILPDTKRVILEVANFESTGIRRTALRYDNRTEASSRYEKAIDPERCGQALSLPKEGIATASTMLLAVVGFMILGKISYPFNRMKWGILALNLFCLAFSGLFLGKLFAISAMSEICILLMVVFGFAAESLFRYLSMAVEWAAGQGLGKRFRRALSALLLKS